MELPEPYRLLAGLRGEGKRLCFYPSAGCDRVWAVMGMRADIFVFSDYCSQRLERRDWFWKRVVTDFEKHAVPLTIVASGEPFRVFRSGEKWGFFLFEDNNDVLAWISSTGWKIGLFVGICDGCREGGNDECVHDPPFLKKLLVASADPLSYVTDHSRRLVDENERLCRGVTIFKPRAQYAITWEFTLRSLLMVPNERPEPEKSPPKDDVLDDMSSIDELIKRLLGLTVDDMSEDFVKQCEKQAEEGQKGEKGPLLYRVDDQGNVSGEGEDPSYFVDGEECEDGFGHLSPFLLKWQQRVLARYEVRRIRP